MTDEKSHKIINCRYCKRFICRSDGEFLFVEIFEILPKVEKIKDSRREKNTLIVKVTCLECGNDNKIGLRKIPAEIKPEKHTDRKFLIFRSRF